MRMTSKISKPKFRLENSLIYLSIIINILNERKNCEPNMIKSIEVLICRILFSEENLKKLLDSSYHFHSENHDRLSCFRMIQVKIFHK